MNRGFVARGGFVGIGRLSVTRGLGPADGEIYVPPEPVDETGETVVGARAPRAIIEQRRAPTGLLYVPGAKKRRGGP